MDVMVYGGKLRVESGEWKVDSGECMAVRMGGFFYAKTQSVTNCNQLKLPAVDERIYKVSSFAQHRIKSQGGVQIVPPFFYYDPIK